MSRLFLLPLLLLAGCTLRPSTPAEWAAAMMALEPTPIYAYQPTVYHPSVVYVHSVAPMPVSDPCSMMGCPVVAAPGVRYIPVGPGDAANAGLTSNGYPMR